MNDYRIKLTDYQLHSLRSRLDAVHSKVEDLVLDKYKSHDLESLNALDYDDIIEDIADWHTHITKRGIDGNK